MAGQSQPKHLTAWPVRYFHKTKIFQLILVMSFLIIILSFYFPQYYSFIVGRPPSRSPSAPPFYGVPKKPARTAKGLRTPRARVQESERNIIERRRRQLCYRISRSLKRLGVIAPIAMPLETIVRGHYTSDGGY